MIFVYCKQLSRNPSTREWECKPILTGDEYFCGVDHANRITRLVNFFDGTCDLDDIRPQGTFWNDRVLWSQFTCRVTRTPRTSSCRRRHGGWRWWGRGAVDRFKMDVIEGLGVWEVSVGYEQGWKECKWLGQGTTQSDGEVQLSLKAFVVKAS